MKRNEVVPKKIMKSQEIRLCQADIRYCYKEILFIPTLGDKMHVEQLQTFRWVVGITSEVVLKKVLSMKTKNLEKISFCPHSITVKH